MRTVIKDPFIDGFLEQGREQGLEQGLEQGRAQEGVRLLLQVLAARGIPVPDDIRARVSECSDISQLEAWAVRAATATALEEVFAD